MTTNRAHSLKPNDRTWLIPQDGRLLEAQGRALLSMHKTTVNAFSILVERWSRVDDAEPTQSSREEPEPHAHWRILALWLERDFSLAKQSETGFIAYSIRAWDAFFLADELVELWKSRCTPEQLARFSTTVIDLMGDLTMVLGEHRAGLLKRFAEEIEEENAQLRDILSRNRAALQKERRRQGK